MTLQYTCACAPPRQPSSKCIVSSSSSSVRAQRLQQMDTCCRSTQALALLPGCHMSKCLDISVSMHTANAHSRINAHPADS
eukprot:1161685-Pelagomonas_calceolata.AAC.20